MARNTPQDGRWVSQAELRRKRTTRSSLRALVFHRTAERNPNLFPIWCCEPGPHTPRRHRLLQQQHRQLQLTRFHDPTRWTTARAKVLRGSRAAYRVAQIWNSGWLSQAPHEMPWTRRPEFGPRHGSHSPGALTLPPEPRFTCDPPTTRDSPLLHQVKGPLRPSSTFPHAPSVSQPRPCPVFGSDRQPGPPFLLAEALSLFGSRKPNTGGGSRHCTGGTLSARIPSISSAVGVHLEILDQVPSLPAPCRDNYDALTHHSWPGFTLSPRPASRIEYAAGLHGPPVCHLRRFGSAEHERGRDDDNEEFDRQKNLLGRKTGSHRALIKKNCSPK